MVILTAARALARNMYDSKEFDPATNPNETTSYTNVEYIIDDIIDWINNETGSSISSMAGSAGAKTVTLTAAQNSVMSMLLPIMLRETKQTIITGGGMGPLSFGESLYGMDKTTKNLFYRALAKLSGTNFDRV